MLDVRCSQWYEDMAAIRAAMRDLEQMLGNILATAVEHASCLTTKLDVIEAFAQITTRDGLRQAQAPAVLIRMAEERVHAVPLPLSQQTTPLTCLCLCCHCPASAGRR